MDSTKRANGDMHDEDDRRGQMVTCIMKMTEHQRFEEEGIGDLHHEDRVRLMIEPQKSTVISGASRPECKLYYPRVMIDPCSEGKSKATCLIHAADFLLKAIFL
jgi:hypothetical protein